MKNLFILAFMLMGMMTFGANPISITGNHSLTVHEVDYLNTGFSTLFGRITEIDMTFVADDGCKYHVTGWVNFVAHIGWPPVAINGYDLTVTGPCLDSPIEISEPIDNGTPDDQPIEVNPDEARQMIIDLVNNELK